jgi:hypothetical protein
MPSDHKRSFLCLLILKELRKAQEGSYAPNEAISTGIWYALVRSVFLMSASDRIKRRALNSAVECHLHTVEVIGSNPIAPTIFSITCKRPCCFRGSIWVQQAHNTALGSPFRWRHRLHIMIHRHADICMAHERLHNSHIFTVSLQPSTERMAKRVPTQTFGYLGSNGPLPAV